LRSLAAHQLDTWRATITPITGLEEAPATGSGAAVSLGAKRLQISVPSECPGAKLLLLQRDGQTVEANFDLSPSQLMSIDLPDSQQNPLALVVRRADRTELIRVEPGEPPCLLKPAEFLPPEPLLDGPKLEMSTQEIRLFEFPLQHRALANFLLGINEIIDHEPLQADERFEQSLLFNGEDHLCWWAKAAAKRQANLVDEEQLELPNAHYLAPLEPVLRAEGFLAQSMAMSAEANPLLKPLEEIPENFVEVACTLIECGFNADASRWIDEAIRHVDLPMLRYLHAYCFLTGTRLVAEVSEQVSAAARLPFGPPYPWRLVERKALKALHERFPSNDRLREYWELVKH